MMRALVVCALALTSVAGCAVTFNDSAPATPGSRYVVGSYKNEAAVYLCPDKPKAGECKPVEVEFKD
jgi:hypothetical protein